MGIDYLFENEYNEYDRFLVPVPKSIESDERADLTLYSAFKTDL